MHELEHEGAARADVGAVWEEIAADESLGDGGLDATLAPHHHDLRLVDCGAPRLSSPAARRCPAAYVSTVSTIQIWFDLN